MRGNIMIMHLCVLYMINGATKLIVIAHIKYLQLIIEGVGE